MPLTAKAVETAKPKAKAYKLHDANGLFLHVQPGGSKLWRFRYRLAGKERSLSIGNYPLFSLADARRRRDDARRVLADGGDPAEERRAIKAEEQAQGETFRKVSEEWLTVRMATRSESHQRITRRRLELYMWPTLGDEPVAGITAPMVLAPLRLIEERGKHETAHRVLQIAGQVMRYAVATGKATGDPTTALRGALRPVEPGHMAAPAEDPGKVGGILRALDGYEGRPATRAAARLLPLLFCRPGELRTMRWSDLHDLDGEAPEWRYLVSKTKTPHVVPLARQALAILDEIRPHTGTREWVFPCERSPLRPMSNMAVNAALRRLGIGKDELTGHGWRAVARTMLAERLKFDPAIIEHQLAHKAPGALGAAYNRTRYLDERRVMMQRWADYLDELKRGAEA